MCRRERQYGRSRRGRIAQPRRCAGLRADGAMDWFVRSAGDALHVHVRCLVAQRDGSDVHTYEHLSCGAMDEANRKPMDRCPTVSTRCAVTFRSEDSKYPARLNPLPINPTMGIPTCARRGSAPAMTCLEILRCCLRPWACLERAPGGLTLWSLESWRPLRCKARGLFCGRPWPSCGSQRAMSVPAE